MANQPLLHSPLKAIGFGEIIIHSYTETTFQGFPIAIVANVSQ